MTEKNLTIKLSYNDHTQHFFIDFLEDESVLISHKITEGQAQALSRRLGIKIMIG